MKVIFCAPGINGAFIALILIFIGGEVCGKFETSQYISPCIVYPDRFEFQVQGELNGSNLKFLFDYTCVNLITCGFLILVNDAAVAKGQGRNNPQIKHRSNFKIGNNANMEAQIGFRPYSVKGTIGWISRIVIV